MCSAIVILCLVCLTCNTMTVRVVFRDFSFAIQHSQNITFDTAAYLMTLKSSSRMECAKSCALNPICLSFFLTTTLNFTGKSDKKHWTCRLLSRRIKENDLSSGDGTYGHMTKFKTQPKAPAPLVLNSGVFQSFTRTEHGKAAVYNCSAADSRVTNIAFLYDHDNDRWPLLSPACSSTICSQPGLSAAMLKITKHASINGVIAKIICQEDEIHVGNALCFESGKWTFSNRHTKVGCVSKSCYRTDVDDKSVYKGTKTVDSRNITCQHWSSQTPWKHKNTDSMFVIDGGSSANAGNYCRDPDGSGAPWCYPLIGRARWTFCGIPLCRLELVNEL